MLARERVPRQSIPGLSRERSRTRGPASVGGVVVRNRVFERIQRGFHGPNDRSSLTREVGFVADTVPRWETEIVRTIITGVWVVGQAMVLLLAGLATLWWSSDLMRWLIWLVGEEYALGARNVIRLENGSTLLTNPSAMVRGMIPFWCLGLIQITSCFTLIWLWVGRSPTRQGKQPVASSRNAPGELTHDA